MRKVSLDTITGSEVLGKDIVTSCGITLMVAGTVVKKEYVEKLYELNIQYIFIKDDLFEGINESDIIENKIKQQCQATIKEVIERFSYSGTKQLDEIIGVADEIITDVLRQKEVIYNISGIRDKSEHTYAHSLNVCALAVLVSIKMKIPRQKIKEIAIGSLLHDIGFLFYDNDYSDINIDECSEEERKLIKNHVILGYSLVNKEGWLSHTSKDIIVSHHERLDGSGYPLCKTDSKIRKATKIVAVCDEFDSRVYGNQRSRCKVHDAIDYIVSQADIKFDINVVRVFMDSVAAYPIGTIVITNRGDKGIVLRQNQKCPTRPVIRLIADVKGEKYRSWIEQDLAQDLTLFIEDTILE